MIRPGCNHSAVRYTLTDTELSRRPATRGSKPAGTTRTHKVRAVLTGKGRGADGLQILAWRSGGARKFDKKIKIFLGLDPFVNK